MVVQTLLTVWKVSQYCLRNKHACKIHLCNSIHDFTHGFSTLVPTCSQAPLPNSHCCLLNFFTLVISLVLLPANISSGDVLGVSVTQALQIEQKISLLAPLPQLIELIMYSSVIPSTLNYLMFEVLSSN